MYHMAQDWEVGSSDAATTIKMLNLLFELNIAIDDLFDFGMTIGSDVGACMVESAVKVQGKGEILTPIKLERLLLVIIKPNESFNTKEMYDKLDKKIPRIRVSLDVIPYIYQNLRHPAFAIT